MDVLFHYFIHLLLLICSEKKSLLWAHTNNKKATMIALYIKSKQSYILILQDDMI